MNAEQLEHFRGLLEGLRERVERDLVAVSEQARSASSGQALGELSNAPLHLADMGSDEYIHDLNATLLENEEGIAREATAALGRIRRGEFGRCEACGDEIALERLEGIPYTRYCFRCADSLGNSAPSNLNRGRPEGPSETISLQDDMRSEEEIGVESFSIDAQPHPRNEEADDTYAAGTAGGGTAIGGLAGSNRGNGEPDLRELQEAAGSGEYDINEANSRDLDPRTGSPRKSANTRRPKRIRKKF